MKKNPRYTSCLYFSVFLFSLILIAGCRRDSTTGGGNNEIPVDDNIMISASVTGIVVNENNQPVQGAPVSSGTNTTTTDQFGRFRFNNISLSKENGYVKVTKPGYFTGTRTFFSTAGRTHNVRIKLLPKTNSGSLAGSAGGNVTITGGGKLVMPANGVTDASGTPYAGTVNVAMTWIDPTSNDLVDVIPGDLRGVTTANIERSLETFGMLGVELTGNTGQPLKMASGKKAELTFPIPASLQGQAPATIDLWNFDEATGRWKQEGTATKNGSNYLAQVSHFSFWNCDASFPLVNLCMNLVNAANNSPLNNVQVVIRRQNNTAGSGRTDSAGNLCGKVPKDEAMVLEVKGNCNNIIYSQNIGPFGNDASLGTISVALPAPLTLTITGTLVNCSNANVANGAVTAYISGGYSYSIPVTNGAFSLTLIGCGSGINFSLLGVDYATLQQTGPVTGSGTSGSVNVGTVKACGTSVAKIIEFTVDGVPFSYISPVDSFLIMQTLTSPVNDVTIMGMKTGAGSNNMSSFTFRNDNTTGVKEMTQCRVTAGSFGFSQVISTPNPTLNLTSWSQTLGGTIEGNFNIQMLFGTTTRTVSCTFRLRI